MKSYLWEQDTYRYVLGVEGKNPLIFIGLNPSTAIPKHPDMTYYRLCKLLEDEKSNSSETRFDSIILLNLCPFVTAESNELPMELSKYHLDKNLNFTEKILEECFNKNNELNILLGWGSGIYKRTYFTRILKDIKNILEKYKSFSKFYYVESKDKKYPVHPIRYKKELNSLNFARQYADILPFLI